MKDLTKGPVTRQIISFALPMLIGNVFQQVYSMADAMVVGRYIGGGVLAAVGTSAFLMNFSLAVMIGLATGSSVLVSQFFGAKQMDQLTRTVSTSLIFLFSLVAVVSIGGVLFAPLLLRILNVPPDIFESALLYLRILMGGMVFTMLYNISTAYLRALGDTRVPLYILMASTTLNICLDLLFVIRFQLGVAGVAWATVISQFVAAGLCYLYILRYVPVLRVRSLVFDRTLFRPILKYSIPAAIQLSLVSFASLTIMRLVNTFGSIAAAGYSAAVKIDQFAIMPLANISMAISTFTAQNMGAKREDRAKKGLFSSMAIMTGLAVVLSLTINLFGRQILSLFVDTAAVDSAEIVRIGSEYLAIISSFYVLFAVFFAFNGFFRGVGDAVIVMALTIFSLTIRAVCAYLLVYFADMGVEAVSWSIPIGWGLSNLICVYYYKKHMWGGKLATTP